MSHIKHFKTKLLKILKPNKSDINVGIYKIINWKSDVIDNFINNKLEDIIQKSKDIKSKDLSDIFNHLCIFFSKYYKDGNFESKFDISSENNKQQVKLCWINQDQYYVKSDKVGRKSVDFFVHKDLNRFLNQELNYYIKLEILNDINKLDEITIVKSKVVFDIGTRIIDLLSEIENLQKRLWEKKKFVIKTEYVITSDRLPECLYEEVLNNEKQKQEWIDLGIVKNINEIESLKVQKLPIDTKYFSGRFKETLLTELSEKHNIDDYLDGTLIKSENWQALNLLIERYKEKIQTIYIDPPYNTGKNNFYYKDFYGHSSWISMIIDRLNKAKYFLKDKGFIFVSIDDNELYYLKQLMDNEFGALNFIANFIWRKRAGGGSDSKFVAIDHEYIICYAKNAYKSSFCRFPPNIKNYPFIDSNGKRYTKKPLHNSRLRDNQSLHYDIICPDQSILDGEKHQWVYSKDTFDKLYKNGRILFTKSKDKTWKVSYKHYMDDTQGEIPRSILYNISLNSAGVKEHKCLGIDSIYNYPKPTMLINYFIEISSLNNEDIILDFFAGSGSTAESVLKINQKINKKLKFILIEMDNCFDSIIIPRMKKILFSDWENGKPKNKHKKNEKGGGFLKYQYLEQYEDTLHNEWDFTEFKISEIKTPFDYKIKVISNDKDRKEEEVTVDLVETFNYLIGLKVNKIKYAYNQQDNNRKYIFIEGEIDNNKIAVIWRDITDLDNKTDKKFIEENLINIEKYGNLYINGKE